MASGGSGSSHRAEAWRKPLSGGFRVLQVLCLATGVFGLVALAASPVDSWFRNGVGVVVGMLMGVAFAWTVWFGAGWAFLVVHRGQVRMGFTAVPWARVVFPLSAVAEVDSVDVDFLAHGGRVVGGDPAAEGRLVTSGGPEAVRFDLWDGSTYLVTLRRSDEVVNRLRQILHDST